MHNSTIDATPFIPFSLPSGEHKVKVAGAIVSEQSGEQDGLENAGAVEHVHDIIFRSHSRHGHGGRVFDIRNHV